MYIMQPACQKGRPQYELRPLCAAAGHLTLVHIMRSIVETYEIPSPVCIALSPKPN